MSEPFCAAVDWGTTSFRLWLVDGAGQVLAERRSGEGMASLDRDRYSGVLEGHLAALSAPPGLPVVVCGMAGSRQGWREAPYIDTPARLDELFDGAVSIDTVSRDVRILPGVAQRDPAAPDVMRGEETQLLGAVGDEDGPVLCCLPGTHSKWVALDGRIARMFRTFMTGDLFAAIGGHTVLASLIDAEAGGADEAAFGAAVDRMLAAPEMLTASLFSLRAGNLLGFAAAADAGPALSGLLIGAEIAAARAEFGSDDPVRLIATGRLAKLYGHALDRAGFDVVAIDADAAVLAGLVRAAQSFWQTGEARARA